MQPACNGTAGCFALPPYSCRRLQARAQATAPCGPRVFAYFENNGEDGLHLAYSRRQVLMAGTAW